MDKSIHFVITEDGSKTLYHPQVGEHYHSRHGAVQESRHVFLGMGLKHFLESRQAARVSVLEVGFGTGLNFLLSADYCGAKGIALDYIGVEAHPLPLHVVSQTGYGNYVSDEIWQPFIASYSPNSALYNELTPYYNLEVIWNKILDFDTDKKVDVLYFDAFASIHQPDMWNVDTLSHVGSFLKPGGVFVSYAITGHLKRTMKSLGFAVEKVPGAPGKREMLRAVKQ